jgi:hypothetical protein
VVVVYDEEEEEEEEEEEKEGVKEEGEEKEVVDEEVEEAEDDIEGANDRLTRHSFASSFSSSSAPTSSLLAKTSFPS